MVKYHISPKDNKPRECNATEVPCRLSHYDNERDAWIESEKRGEAIRKDHGLSRSSKEQGISIIENTVSGEKLEPRKTIPMKYGSYHGAHIERDEIVSYINQWKAVFGDANASKMMSMKAERDGGEVYHCTVLSPQDTKMMKKKYGKKLQGLENGLPDSEITVLGIGRAVEDNGNETWFLVCEDEKMNNWRESEGLKKHDFHITLGFLQRDIHGVDKSASSIVS